MRADKRIARLTMRDAGPNRLISKEKTGRVANSPSRSPDPFAQCWRGRAESSRPMSAPLSRYLKDFSAPKLNMTALPPVHVPRAAEPARSDIHYTPKPAPEPKIDIEAERQSAYGRGREHAEAELGARHAAELEALRAAHAAELAVLERRLLDEAALTIHRRYSELGAALATILTAQTAEVLRPVLTTRWPNGPSPIWLPRSVRRWETGRGSRSPSMVPPPCLQRSPRAFRRMPRSSVMWRPRRSI